MSVICGLIRIFLTVLPPRNLTRKSFLIVPWHTLVFLGGGGEFQVVLEILASLVHVDLAFSETNQLGGFISEC